MGDSFFTQNWVTAPASTEARDGLGPTLNAQSCSSCHTLDGRAKPPDHADDPERGLLFRLSIPGVDPTTGAPALDPAYGGQLQDRALLTVPPEGRFLIAYREVPGTYVDGTPYTLLQPEYSFSDLAFGPMHPEIMISPRIAPSVFGMGLLEALPEADILAKSDPDDADGDGISGRANMAWSVRDGETRLGRFGWKANVPTVEQQIAGAFHGDIGITSPLFMDENCPTDQVDCRSVPNGGSPEIGEERLGKVVFYQQTLAVPAMRDVDDPQVRQGAELFLKAGCAACHTPSHTTGDHPVPAISNQVIFPYTDSAAARYGRRSGGRQARFPGNWAGMAHAAPLGHRFDPEREQPHPAASRRPRPRASPRPSCGTTARGWTHGRSSERCPARNGRRCCVSWGRCDPAPDLGFAVDARAGAAGHGLRERNSAVPA